MGNYEFWTSISAIIRNGFDREGLNKLEEYAEQFINGQLLFKRYTENEQFGCAVGGSLHVIASILAGAETPANQLTVLRPTYDAISHGYRGWEVGMNYTVFKNILATLRYGDNKQLRDDATKDKILFGRVEFFF